MKVAGQPLEQFMTENIAKHKDHAQLKRLPLAKNLDTLTKARASLQEYTKTIGDWEFPMDFGVERAKFMKFVEAYKEASRDCMRHEVRIRKVNRKARVEHTAAARAWRAERDKIRTFTENRKLPAGISWVFANAMHSRACDPATVGIQQTYISPKAPDVISVEALGSGFLVEYDAQLSQDKRSPPENDGDAARGEQGCSHYAHGRVQEVHDWPPAPQVRCRLPGLAHSNRVGAEA